MTLPELQRVSDLFDAYAGGYRQADPRIDENIRLKIDHTRRVEAEIRALSDALGVSPELARTAQAAAILHDVGRFEQFSRYGTFDDARSADHAVLGEEILAVGRHLDWLGDARRDRLLAAVRYHNRVRLPAMDDERTHHVCALLRDADKLDIWGMVAADYRTHGVVPDRPFYRGLVRTAGVSAGVWDAVRERRPVDFRSVANLNDYVVLQAAMVFDLNYAPAFRAVLAREILPSIRSVLPGDDPAVDDLFAAVGGHARRMAEAAPASLAL